MHPSNQQTTLIHPISRSPWPRGIFLISLACLALSQAARAVDPPPDGDYPNQNTAEGQDALFSLTSGFSNTANGFDALFSVTTGSANTATGSVALQSNVTGDFNTATGAGALAENTTGNENTAHGWNALASNTLGVKNTASGCDALFANATGNNNAADGYQALFNSTGSNNIGLGGAAGRNLTTGGNNIDIGNAGVAGESKTIRIGTNGKQINTFVAGISGATVPGGVGVIIDTNGHLGTVVSSARFKDEIKPMDKASEVILALQPVTFRYKHDLDPDGIPQFGLVAEQVAKVNPNLVARDGEGKPYTVRYEAVNAMLLNEFLKEHRKGEEQDSKQKKLEATVAQQQKAIEALTAALKAQGAQIQRVSDQLRGQAPTPRVVADN